MTVNKDVEQLIVKAIGPVVRGANRSEVARRTGITLSHVSRVLSGKRAPSSGKLAAIALFLNVQMGDLHIYLASLQKKSKRRRQAAA